MATGGNLVFQGRGDGKFIAYQAKDGKKLWEFDAKHGISAPPITYSLDGKQFIALPVGWGGGAAMLGGTMAGQHGWAYGAHPRRLLVFALGGEAELPETPGPIFAKPLDDPSFEIDAGLAEQGEDLWGRTCFWCHGPAAVASGGAPDLRSSGVMFDIEALKKVVLGGQRISRGMPSYDGQLDENDVLTLQHYVRLKARNSLSKVAAN